MLKVLLSLLLSKFYSKKEASIVGHQAMPSNQYTRLVSNGTIGSEWTAQAFSGVAAYDGYLFFAGTSTSAVPIVGIATAGASSNLTFPWLGARLSTTIPIAKGESWTVQGSSMEEVIIDLTSTIGGGYLRSVVSAVFKRGESCLSNLSLCLPRSPLRIDPSGLVTKQCQTMQQNGLYTHLKALMANISRRLTVMPPFTPVAMNGHKFGTGIEVSLFQQKVQLTSAFKWLSQRVLKSGTSFKSPWLMVLKKRSLSLFQQLERNTLTGGALC